MPIIFNETLINKYHTQGPRFTSYPTVPYWDNETFNLSDWKDKTLNSFQIHNESDGVSVYIHLPYCESLCTFCACHKGIIQRNELEQPYINTVIIEWLLYVRLFKNSFPSKPIILRELH